MALQNIPSKIGVVGTGGRLGAIIHRMLERMDGVDAVPIRTLPDGIDAVINAAPLPSAELHRLALESNCHVIDVTIDGRLIREMIALHSLAQEHSRCLVAMAGLAPGLTGLLARKMLRSTPDAKKVQVSLLQNSVGTAGRQGALDMVNLLTDPTCVCKSRPYPDRHGKKLSTRKMFDLYTPELEFLVDADEMHFVTGFNNRYMNSAIATMAVVRRLSPPIFRWVRDTVADAKARAGEATTEEIELGAVVFNSEAIAIADRLVRLTSDYRATAAVACATAMLVMKGPPYSGAGHLCDFFELDDIVDHPLVQAQVLEN